MSENLRYLKQNELASMMGISPELVDQIGEASGGKAFHNGFGCYIYDQRKIMDYYSRHMWELNKKRNQPKEPEPRKKYMNVCELADALGVTPEEADQIGEDAGAKSFHKGLNCDLYDLEICEEYMKAQKDKYKLYATAPKTGINDKKLNERKALKDRITKHRRENKC